MDKEIQNNEPSVLKKLNNFSTENDEKKVNKTADRKAYFREYYRKNKDKLYQKNKEYYLAYWKKNYKPKNKKEEEKPTDNQE